MRRVAAINATPTRRSNLRTRASTSYVRIVLEVGRALIHPPCRICTAMQVDPSHTPLPDLSRWAIVGPGTGEFPEAPRLEGYRRLELPFSFEVAA